MRDFREQCCDRCLILRLDFCIVDARTRAGSARRDSAARSFQQARRARAWTRRSDQLTPLCGSVCVELSRLNL
jgi:hypothetical protein